MDLNNSITFCDISKPTKNLTNPNLMGSRSDRQSRSEPPITSSKQRNAITQSSNLQEQSCQRKLKPRKKKIYPTCLIVYLYNVNWKMRFDQLFNEMSFLMHVK